MSIPAKTSGALGDIRVNAGKIYIVPFNAECKSMLDTWFATYGSLTTVAIAQTDAGRGGFGETNEKYQALEFSCS